MKNSVKVEWDFLGAEFALLDDENQAKFFKGFVAELENYDSHYSKEMQMVSINHKLTGKERSVLEKYLPAIFFRPEGPERTNTMDQSVARE